MKRGIGLSFIAVFIAISALNSAVGYAVDMDISEPGTEMLVPKEDNVAVKGSPWCSAHGYPSRDDLVAIGDEDRIVCPLDKSYLSNYKTRYVDTSADNVAYVYRNSKKTTEDPERLDQGAKVIVIAEEGTSSCIIYKTYQNKPRSGWISKQFLSKTYVGEMLEIGKPIKGEALIGDVEFEYSGEYMKGTECEYLLLDDPIRNCTGFTLEYKVRHSTGNAAGGRDVYINNGDGWIWIGDFPYTSAKSYHVEVHLGKPADVYAIAIPPFSTVSGDYDARQNILDVFVLP